MKTWWNVVPFLLEHFAVIINFYFGNPLFFVLLSFRTFLRIFIIIYHINNNIFHTKVVFMYKTMVTVTWKPPYIPPANSGSVHPGHRPPSGRRPCPGGPPGAVWGAGQAVPLSALQVGHNMNRIELKHSIKILLNKFCSIELEVYVKNP